MRQVPFLAASEAGLSRFVRRALLRPRSVTRRFGVSYEAVEASPSVLPLLRQLGLAVCLPSAPTFEKQASEPVDEPSEMLSIGAGRESASCVRYTRINRERLSALRPSKSRRLRSSPECSRSQAPVTAGPADGSARARSRTAAVETFSQGLWCNPWPVVSSLTIKRGEGRHDGEVPGFGGAVRGAALRP